MLQFPDIRKIQFFRFYIDFLWENYIYMTLLIKKNLLLILLHHIVSLQETFLL